MDFPKRIIFFCDCGARFDSLDTAGAHAKDCAAGGLSRELAMTQTERAIAQAFEKVGASDFVIVLSTLAKIEVLRRRGPVPTDPATLTRVCLESRPEGATDEELNAAMIEAAGWYEMSEEDLARLMGYQV